MLTMNRRGMMKLGLGGGSFLLLNEWPGKGLFAATSQAPQDGPHFFLHIVVPFGMDSSYLFDARPLAMTAAGLQSNYIGEDPVAYAGRNGGQTLITKLTRPLAPFLNDLTIINGVHMAATFDGHDQNTNLFLTGNPFGGESFIPHLNEGKAHLPLDYVQDGFLFANVTNASLSMPVGPDTARSMLKKLETSSRLNQQSPLFKFMQARMVANSNGKGRFSAASRLMADALTGAPALEDSIRSMDLPDDQGDSLSQRVATVFAFMKAGISPSAILSLMPAKDFLDTHDATSAQKTPVMLEDIANQLAFIMNYLKTTPYDDRRSLMDVTTFIVNSEFSRSMRQLGNAIDETGTDHNPMNNSVLIGGKGIKTGMVIGSSDSQTPDEILSEAHKSLDPEHLKVMGRPFEHASMTSKPVLPVVYSPYDYLGFSSVANTIYTLFGADKKHLWLVERNGKTSEVLTGLLS